MRWWSGEHLAALALTAAAASLLVIGARRLGDSFVHAAGRVLAPLILAGFVGEELTYALRGRWALERNLPLHLTDVVTLVSVAALWRPGSALLAELVYLWALSASVQAVVTPDLGRAFPDPLFFGYFLTHSGSIIAGCLLMFGMRRAPRPGAVARAYAATAVVAVVAATATLLTGGNYMFLRRKPVRGSLLDVMGPWPLYILTGAALGLILFIALAALARAVSPRAGDGP
jgi:hypothetical integral membrane protein (TIGR02206 family)